LRYQIDQTEESGEHTGSEESEKNEGKTEVTLVGEASRRKAVKSNVKAGREIEHKVKTGKKGMKYRDTAEESDTDGDSGMFSPSPTTLRVRLDLMSNRLRYRFFHRPPSKPGDRS